ncbi:MAG: leucine-rich repeat domain-containing protein [Lachnospiraceae bacterium]|nr:leucine-rich repeat domain-containing protein [Lachnospiraceae bacterium]
MSAERVDHGERQETLLYMVTDEGEAVIIGGYVEEGTVIIPSRIGGFPVAGIGEGAFRDRTDIRKVVVEHGVRYIAAQAFAGGTEIEEVELGEGLQYIGEGAFMGDVGIRELLLPESLAYVGANAFGNCSGLASFTFPQGAYVDDYAFEGSAWQEERDSGKFRIRGSRLMDARGNTGPVLEIPYGVTETEDFHAYDINPPALLDKDAEYEEIILPDTLVRLGACCFNHTRIRRMCIPEGVREIPVGAFWESSLAEVTLPQGLEVIGEYAFGGTQLTEIQLPDTLRRIEGDAFSKTEHLEKIVIPSSVHDISGIVFYKSGLSELVIEEGTTVFNVDACPQNIERLQLPESLEFIVTSGNFYSRYLRRMYIPGGASYHGERKLLYYFVKYEVPITIYGQEGSWAQELAEEFGMEFVAVESGDDMP